MPIYMVRWPELTVSLVSASDEKELRDRLDEVADPGGCTWEIYEGPLWVDFELPVKVDLGDRKDKRRPLSPENVKIDTGELAQDPSRLVMSDGGSGDTGYEMCEQLREFAFPALHRALEDAPRGDHEALDPESLKAAVTEDLQTLIEYTWRQAQLEARNDPEAEMMRQLGVTVKFGALDQPGEGDGDREPDND
ncbi:hypothetical protein ACFL51_00850 [Myxococcota bacterium]